MQLNTFPTDKQISEAFAAAPSCPGVDAVARTVLEGTEEERAYRMWINSLNIEDVYCNNLYEDGRDGVMHSKIINRLKAGTIDMKKIDLKAKNKFALSGNCT